MPFEGYYNHHGDFAEQSCLLTMRNDKLKCRKVTPKGNFEFRWNSHWKAKRIVAKGCRADSTLFRQLSFLGHAKTLAGIATARPE